MSKTDSKAESKADSKAESKVEEEWKPPFRGLTHVTGEPDTGKSTLCYTVPGVQPEEMCVLDDDLKTRGLAESLETAGHPFWKYVDLTTQFKELATNTKKAKPIDFYFFVNGIVQDILNQILHGERKQPKVLVFDNWSRMEPAIRSYSELVMSNISDLSPNQQKSMSRMTWPYTYDEYSRFLGELLKVAPMVFLTTHIKEKWNAPGVLVPKGQQPIVEKSVLRLWLRHNPDGPVPVGLVLKRIQKMEVTPTGLKPVNVLPRRINPCNWERIYYYMANPMGDRQPDPSEVPNDFEYSILDGTLTADQKNALKLAANQQNEEDSYTGDSQAAAQAEVEMAARAKELKTEQGMSLPDIVKQFNGAVTPAQVAKWLSN